ncbi:MAG: hypothetical protein ABW020_00840 [Candidatus Rokuibacteriota bacterium]
MSHGATSLPLSLPPAGRPSYDGGHRAPATRARAEAHDALADVYDWFSEGFATPDLVDARALIEAVRAR